VSVNQPTVLPRPLRRWVDQKAVIEPTDSPKAVPPSINSEPSLPVGFANA
jgi:hypothetical protein